MTDDRGYAIASLRATRTRKARHDGRCPLCPHPVRIGHRVGLVPAGWAHCSCIVRVNASRQLTPRSDHHATTAAPSAQPAYAPTSRRHSGRALPLHRHDHEGHPVQAPGRARLGPLPHAPARPDDPGGGLMAALADLVSPRDRQRLEERLAELREVEQLVREIPVQRPPDAPPALAELADRNRHERALRQAG